MINTEIEIGSFVSLSHGILIANEVEKAIIPAGYHCALGGSVLHAGVSAKDVDIFIYPHCGRCLRPEDLRTALKGAGFKPVAKWGFSENSNDTKEIELWDYNGTRIDFFFVK